MNRLVKIRFNLDKPRKAVPGFLSTTAGNSTSPIQRGIEYIKGVPGPIGKIGVEALAQKVIHKLRKLVTETRATMRVHDGILVLPSPL